MNLSKSKYCNGIQCKKMLWLDKYKSEVKEEINNDSILEQGNLVHEVARYLFPNHLTIPYNDDLKEMIKDTYTTIESYQDIVICEASFNYQNNFCSVDILKKHNDEYEMYEIKSSTEIKDIYINDTSYQYYVLNNLGFNIKKCYLVYVNSSYVRHGHIDLDKLFIKEDIYDKVLSLQVDVKNNLDDFNKYMDQINEPLDDIDNKCFKPYKCPFFKYCTRHLPEKNVFDIAGMYTSTKMKLYQDGIYSYEDLLKSNIKDNYKMQIRYELNNLPDYIDKDKIKSFLNTLSYPLYFLDFETYQMPIPLYDNVSPYEQIPFQYSLHFLEKDNSKLGHKEFLAEAGSDPRRLLAERLVKDIPYNVCTLAYNMSFEKTVIKKLASLYPDLSDHLMNIHDNIKDLMIPFKNREYYNRDMHGSYSIKYVLPALFPSDEELNYHNLDLIHNGSEAMNSFRSLENLDKETLEYTRQRLLEYCKLDTYAMVKIYKKLKEIIK